MFIVDVGGGTTESAVVAGGQVVRARSLRMGGNAMDEAIVTAVKTELGLMLGRNAARHLKITLGLAGDGPAGWKRWAWTPRGAPPGSSTCPGELVAQALEPIVTAIVDCVEEMLSDIPPDLAEDVVRGKIRLAGAGRCCPAWPTGSRRPPGIPAVVVDDPLRCVARGAAEILEHGDGLQQGPVAARGKRWPRGSIKDHAGARAGRAERVAGPSGVRATDRLNLTG